MKSVLKKSPKVTLTRKILKRKIGELIKDLRLKKGLSQKQAADRCGCSLAFWKRYEKKGFEGIPALLKIAVSLGGALTPMINLLEKRIPLQELSTIPIGGTQDGAKRDMDLPEIESYLKKEDRIWVKEKLQALAWLAQGMKVLHMPVAKRIVCNLLDWVSVRAPCLEKNTLAPGQTRKGPTRGTLFRKIRAQGRFFRQIRGSAPSRHRPLGGHVENAMAPLPFLQPGRGLLLHPHLHPGGIFLRPKMGNLQKLAGPRRPLRDSYCRSPCDFGSFFTELHSRLYHQLLN